MPVFSFNYLSEKSLRLMSWAVLSRYKCPSGIRLRPANLRCDSSDRFSLSRHMTRKPSPRNQPARGSKDRGSAPKSSDSKRHPSLVGLRGEIDRLDQNLVTLLNRRAEIASQIGRIKHDQGIEVWSAARENEVISQALAASPGPLPPKPCASSFASS